MTDVHTLKEVIETLQPKIGDNIYEWLAARGDPFTLNANGLFFDLNMLPEVTIDYIRSLTTPDDDPTPDTPTDEVLPSNTLDPQSALPSVKPVVGPPLVMKKDVKDRVYQIVRRVTEDAAIGKTDTNNKYAVCVKKYMKRIPHGDASSYNNVLVKENFD